MKNKTFIYTSFILILAVSGLCYCTPVQNYKPSSVNGVLDLSDYNFKNDRSILLDADWEYYPMLRLSPDDLNSGKYKKDFINFSRKGELQHGWEYFNPASYYGFATYRLKIITGRNYGNRRLENNLGMYILTARPSYKLFINGVLVHENGRPAADDLAVVSGHSASVIPLSSSETAFDIVLQADNFRFPYGTIYNIRIGSFAFLNGSLQKYNFIYVFLLIAIFILGLNQLILFLLQRRNLWRSELLYLYFGLGCFGQLLFGIGAHHTYWSLILPSFPWDSLSMLMMSAIYIGDLFFLLYFRRLFPLDVPKGFFYIIGISYVIFGLITAFLPAIYIAHIVPAYHAHVVASSVIYIFMIIRTAAKRRENSMLVLYGALAAIVLGAVINFLLGLEIIEGYLDVYSLSMVLFGLVQTITTMRNFIRMQHHSLQITEDNIKLKAIIDRKMASANVVTDNIETKINTAMEYLAGNYRYDISRENLAAALDLHPDNFSRYFKLHTGKGYSEYLNDLRIAEAVRLLSETDESVGSIGEKTGFRSPRTFSRVFINTTGRKPSDYRKNNK